MAQALGSTRGKRTGLAARIGAAVLLAALGILAGIFLARHRDSVPTTVHRKLFTEGDLLQAWSPSPDGRSVAATSLTTGGLILRDVDGGKIHPITTGRAPGFGGTSWVYSASFSPDGRRLAYEWLNGPYSELRLIGADGFGERTLFRSTLTRATPLDWSLDGKRLLVS